jgi:Zn-dependent M28 family amino/carboxypeptidase
MLKFYVRRGQKYLTVYIIIIGLAMNTALNIAYGMDISNLADSLKKHLRVLSKDIGERNFIKQASLARCADYIREEFKNFGYEVYEQVYYINKQPFRNIIATKPAGPGSRVIIVGAHYDSVIGSPGADDNASGVAGLLLLAELLSQHNNLDKTIRFIAFTNEEPPFFTTPDMGSYRYAQELKKKKENIEGMLCLESIGYYDLKDDSQSYPFGLGFFYPSRGNYIAVVSNLLSAKFLKKVVSVLRKNSKCPVESLLGPVFFAPAIAFSDHWSFWKMGYRAVMITDTAFYRNPYYHTSFDTPEKINYEYMAEVVKGLYAVLLAISE